MVKRGDFAEAERLGNELAADVRLRNGLGWNPSDGREIFALTMSAEELLETLWRLRIDAEGGVEEPEEVRRGRGSSTPAGVHWSNTGCRFGGRARARTVRPTPASGRGDIPGRLPARGRRRRASTPSARPQRYQGVGGPGGHVDVFATAGDCNA
jgi:hypothetical protein